MSGAGRKRAEKMGLLAFRSRVLMQERGDGPGFSDLLGERALHVFDGGVGSSVQQQLHDVGKLARRRWEEKRGKKVGGVIGKRNKRNKHPRPLSPEVLPGSLQLIT